MLYNILCYSINHIYSIIDTNNFNNYVLILIFIFSIYNTFMISTMIDYESPIFQKENCLQYIFIKHTLILTSSSTKINKLTIVYHTVLNIICILLINIFIFNTHYYYTMYQ